MKIDCSNCVFLLHYEQDKIGSGRWELPRCSIGFRDGSKVKQPCQDRIAKKEVRNGGYISILHT